MTHSAALRPDPPPHTRRPQEFNCAQRAHQNTLEWLSVCQVLTLVNGGDEARSPESERGVQSPGFKG